MTHRRAWTDYHPAYRAEQMRELAHDAILRVERPPMAYTLEGMVSMKLHVLIRFGKWAEILEEPFPEDREALVREVMALRKDHNFSPDNAIEAVAGALRRHVDEKAFDAVLADIGPEAARFWQPD